jgi:uncharacterized repeat protein (TIGR02543 family)
MKTKLHLLVAFLLLTAIVASCDKEGSEPDMSYTVTFDSNGGTPTPQSQTVKAGENATAPAINPTRTGYVFMFWQLSGSSGAYNFGTPVNSDITLQARWEEEAKVEYWQVSWELNGGTWPEGDNHVTQVVKGGTLAEPAEPSKSGGTFEGWYMESALTDKVTFPYDVSNVTTDITLYAKWTNDSPSGSIDVYLTGYVRNEKGNRVAKVWKNGTELYTLTDGERGAFTSSVYVSGNDVYVAGTEENAAGISEGIVWKNGEKLYSFASGSTAFVSLRSVCVEGNDVYVAGEMRVSGSANATGKVWKNGTELYSLSGASVSKMCIFNNDIYVSGNQSNGSNAKVWKNGTEYWTTNVYGSYSASTHHICASGSNIYVSMNWTSGTSAIIAKINQGDTFTQLFSYCNFSTPSYTAKAESFAVSDAGDVYAAVNTSQNYSTQLWIYKNNTLLYGTPAGSGKMYLSGEDLYYYRTYNGKTTVYKNETELYVLIDTGSIYDSANDILVVEN